MQEPGETDKFLSIAMLVTINFDVGLAGGEFWFYWHDTTPFRGTNYCST